MAHANLGEMLPLFMKNKDTKFSKYKEYLQIHKEKTITPKCRVLIHKIRNMIGQ